MIENERLTLRISKMISEGGIGADPYYYDMKDKKSEDRHERREAAMVDEGGIGAEMYYHEEEMVAKPSVYKSNKKEKLH